MRRLLLLVGLMLVPLVWLGAPPASACSCVTRSVEELVDAADAVVVGRLEERERTRGGTEVVYTFSGAERLKGELPPSFEVRSSAFGASCGLTGLDVGRRYVVFLNANDEVLTANLCGGTQRASSGYVARVEAATGSGTSAGEVPRGAERLRSVVSATTLWG